MSVFCPINEKPPSLERSFDDQHHTSDLNQPAVTGQVNAEKDVDTNSNDGNVRYVNPG